MRHTGIDYATALRECGFDERAVASGVRLLTENRGATLNVRTVVSMLRIAGHQTHVREHEVGPILQRLAAEEVQAQILARGERARLHVAAARLEERDRLAAEARRDREMSEAMEWLIANMTDDEIEERTEFRPHIAEGWRRYLTLKAESTDSPEIEEQLKALDACSRLRRRPAPAPSTPRTAITRQEDKRRTAPAGRRVDLSEAGSTAIQVNGL